MCLDVTQLVDVETADLSMDEMGFLELCRSSLKSRRRLKKFVL